MTKTIPIERLTSGTQVYVTDLEVVGMGDFYTVQSVEDQPNDESFQVWLVTDGWRNELGFSVPYGGSVEFGGVGEPVLKPITLDNVAALICGHILRTVDQPFRVAAE